ncbi:MAG: hypothetical protein ABI418_03335 [Jatrophihabitantaceae bacterium]
MSATLSTDRPVRLRPGAAVYVVDEGLLFCGWQNSALMTCGTGVRRIWSAVEPHLRGGVEPSRLIEQLPEPAVPVLRSLLAELDKHAMLTTLVASAGQSPAEAHLTAFAPDPEGASRAARQARIVLSGPAELTAPVSQLLAECGLSGSGTEPLALYLGDPTGLAVAGPVQVAAVAAGASVLVADCADGTARLLQAALARPAGSVTPISWQVAGALVLERVHRALAGLAGPGTASLIEGQTARTVRLAPLRRPIAQLSWGAAGMIEPAEPSAADELGGQLTGPLPAELVQVPLARQQVSVHGQPSYYGVGLDQERAGADALLAAARAQLPAALDRGGNDLLVGPFPAAGRGGLDLLAEAAGRALVALADPPAGEPAARALADPLVRRWLSSAERLAGPVQLRAGGSAVCPTVALATAEAAGSLSWGYGVTSAQASEHALRGLLSLLLAGDRQAGQVAAAHEVAAETFVRAVLADGLPDELPDLSELAAMVTERIPGLRCQPWDLDGEFESRGIVGATVAVGR